MPHPIPHLAQTIVKTCIYPGLPQPSRSVLEMKNERPVLAGQYSSLKTLVCAVYKIGYKYTVSVTPNYTEYKFKFKYI